MPAKVLCLLEHGFEEIETVAPVDLLRRAGVEVFLASVSGEPWVTGRCNMALRADVTLATVIDETFDLLLIPGGPGVKAIRADGRAAQLARAQVEARRPVAAICAAPTVLADAGLLEGRRFTAHESVLAELPPAVQGEAVVEDDLIITSRGAGTAIEFGLALVRRLTSPAKAEEITRSIHYAG